MKAILFNGGSVRAILEGRKTQTRRVVEFPVRYGDVGVGSPHLYGSVPLDAESQSGVIFDCPHGNVGDRLWVRETFRQYGAYSGHRFIPIEPGWAQMSPVLEREFEGRPARGRWDKGWHRRPSIFMPRSASRITLEITGVQVERVQDISPQDIEREGLTPPSDSLNWVGTFQNNFRLLWNSINAKRGYGWDVNPWVWALTFKVVK